VFSRAALAYQKIFHKSIWLRKVLSTEKDFTESATWKVKKVLFRRRKLPFSSSEKSYFRRNICESFSGPASSVSSERAFSSAGITISKRRNRLKGDIVEALQCLKCMIRKNLIFRQDPTSTIAKEIADLEDVPENELKPESSWDEMVLLDEEVDAEG
jgi:hypothetical protein